MAGMTDRVDHFGIPVNYTISKIRLYKLSIIFTNLSIEITNLNHFEVTVR